MTQASHWAALVHWADLNQKLCTHSDLANNNDQGTKATKAQSERGAALTQCLFQKATTLLAVHGRSKWGDTRRPISPITAAAGPSMIMLSSAMRVMAAGMQERAGERVGAQGGHRRSGAGHISLGTTSFLCRCGAAASCANWLRNHAAATAAAQRTSSKRAPGLRSPRQKDSRKPGSGYCSSCAMQARNRPAHVGGEAHKRQLSTLGMFLAQLCTKACMSGTGLSAGLRRGAACGSKPCWHPCLAGGAWCSSAKFVSGGTHTAWLAGTTTCTAARTLGGPHTQHGARASSILRQPALAHTRRCAAVRYCWCGGTSAVLAGFRWRLA